MIQVTQKEFEEYVLSIIDGKRTLFQAVKDLQTDYRTLNKKIQEMSATNPELYKLYIQKKPYKPRNRQDISALEIALDILKEDKTIEEIAESYQAGVRTISRRLNTLRFSKNPLEREIYDLCKIITYNHSHYATTSPEVQSRASEIRKMLSNTISSDKKDNTEIKRRELLELEAKYNKLCETMSKAEAARAMGYTPNRIYKLLNKLYRIEIEAHTKDDKNVSFRDSMKVEIKPTTPTEESGTNNNLEKEGNEIDK